MTYDEPRIGETWYFSIGDAVVCNQGQILNITPYTVTIKRDNRLFSEPDVYVRSKINFIEKISPKSNYICDND